MGGRVEAGVVGFEKRRVWWWWVKANQSDGYYDGSFIHTNNTNQLLTFSILLLLYRTVVITLPEQKHNSERKVQVET